MNEPFLLSNLIELQELDNEIFKLISEKSDGTTVKELKTHEIEFKKLQSDKQNIENELQLYFDAKNHICLLYTSPSPRDKRQSRMPSSA